MDAYNMAKEYLKEVAHSHRIFEERVSIKARPLSSEEAIGNPETDDFPLQKGKERLMQAEFGTGTGQAFTDRYGDFSGKLKEIDRRGYV